MTDEDTEPCNDEYRFSKENINKAHKVSADVTRLMVNAKLTGHELSLTFTMLLMNFAAGIGDDELRQYFIDETIKLIQETRSDVLKRYMDLKGKK